MKEKLFNELKEQGDPRMFGNGDVFDSYEYAGPRRGRGSGKTEGSKKDKKKKKGKK